MRAFANLFGMRDCLFVCLLACGCGGGSAVVVVCVCGVLVVCCVCRLSVVVVACRASRVSFETSAGALALAGAEMLSIPAAFTFPSGMAHWHVLLRARAIETGCFVVAPAQCGTHADGRRTYGHAMIVSPWGQILAEAPTDDDAPGAGANDAIIHASIDPAAVTSARHAIPSLATNPDFS